MTGWLHWLNYKKIQFHVIIYYKKEVVLIVPFTSKCSNSGSLTEDNCSVESEAVIVKLQYNHTSTSTPEKNKGDPIYVMAILGCQRVLIWN